VPLLVSTSRPSPEIARDYFFLHQSESSKLAVYLCHALALLAGCFAGDDL